MPKIEVLMSTYNGERYIEEQIKSIFSQQGCNIHLLIRDDGSKDGTISIIEHLKEKYPIDSYAGRNLRSAKSFLDLLYHCGEADFYAFADQDDIWKENKLEKAIQMILNSGRSELPIAYCSNLTPVRDRKTIIQDKLLADKIAVKYTQILSRCSDIFGCTMVWNKALQKVLTEIKAPEQLAMHDYWVALIATSYGKIVYDPESLILYRQHDHNTVGAAISSKKNWKGRFSWILKKTKFSSSETAREMLKVFEQKPHIDIGYVKYTKIVANYRNSILSKFNYMIHADMSAMSFKQKCFHIILVMTSSL